MRVFGSLILAAAAHASDFQVTSCNNQATNATEMTISVDQAYMELHHDNLKGSFDLAGGVYTKTIPGPALALNFTDTSYIYLQHELVTADENVAGSSIHFQGRSTTFKCRYPRAVSVDGGFTVPDPTDPDPYVGNGAFHYGIQTRNERGRTVVTITEQHNIPSLEANVNNCAVTFADTPNIIVRPVRNLSSWLDTEVCLDGRISTNFTYANGGAIIDWRTFHFRNPNGSGTSQEHIITCSIHVSNILTVSNPSDCTCTTSEQACGPGTLSQWSNWGTCSVECDGGTQEKTRTCSNTNCDSSLPLVAQQACNEQLCIGILGQWTAWGDCSANCDGGVQDRSRTCSNNNCIGALSEQQACNEQTCVGTLGQWTAWGGCSANCDGGVQDRSRTCSNNNCIGALSEQQACNEQACIGTLGQWTVWGGCSANCDGGVQDRSRTCSNNNCIGALSEQRACNQQACIGTLGGWSGWGSCSAECDGGHQNRQRTCSNNNCIGVLSQSQACNQHQCVGTLGSWSVWGTCSVSCGGGTQERTRTCTNNNCIGALAEQQACNEWACIGIVSQWSPWGSCSNSCGNIACANDCGSRTRTRTCSTNSCLVGHYSWQEDCEESECPVCTGVTGHQTPSCPAGTTVVCKTFCEGSFCRGLQVCAREITTWSWNNFESTTVHYLALRGDDNISDASGGHGKPKGTVRYEAVQIRQEADGVYLVSDWRNNPYAYLVGNHPTHTRTVEWAAVYDCHATDTWTTASLLGHNLKFDLNYFRVDGWNASGDFINLRNEDQQISIRVSGSCGYASIACQGAQDFCTYGEYNMGYIKVNLLTG